MKSLDALLEFWGETMLGCPMYYYGRKGIITGRVDDMLLVREFGSDEEIEADVYSREIGSLATKVVVTGDKPLFFIDENARKFYMAYGLKDLPSVDVPLDCLPFSEFMYCQHLIGDTEVFRYGNELFVGTLAGKGDNISMKNICKVYKLEDDSFEIRGIDVNHLCDAANHFELLDDSKYFNVVMQYDSLVSRIRAGKEAIHE